MSRGQYSIVGSSLLVMAAIASSARPSTLVQTQLIGVKGATVLAFVSQYLPSEVRALEPELRLKAEEMLKTSGMNRPGDPDQFLSIDVTGGAVSSELCSNAFMLQVVVAFSEPVRLSRSPRQRLPNNSTLETWKEVYQDVVPRADIDRIVSTQVREAVQLFIDTVESVNRAEKAK